MLRKIFHPLEWLIRHGIVYPILRLVLNNKPHNYKIDLTRINKMLIFRQDRIDDMIITTPIFRKLKQINPKVHITVLASRINAELILNDPHVDKVIIAQSNIFPQINQIFQLRKQKFEILLNLIFNHNTTIGLLANLICRDGIIINQGQEKNRFYSNHYHTLERGNKHMGEMYIELIEKVFKIRFESDEYQYNITIPDVIKSAIDLYLMQISLARWHQGPAKYNYVILNISATDADKSMSPQQTLKILEYLTVEKQIPTIVISTPSDNRLKEKLVKKTDSDYCFLYPVEGTASLLAIADLIESAAFAITPDTWIIHFASAMQTPVIGLYTPLKFESEWFPYQVKNIIVLAKESEPVSKISLEKILKPIENYLQLYLKR